MIHTSTHYPDITVVKPGSDRLTAVNAKAFKDDISDVINAGGTRLVVDLNEVGFIDSSGLGALVGVLKKIGYHGELVLCLIAELRGVLSPKALSRVQICATEVLTNIVKHARPAAKGKVIEAALHRHPDAVTLEIFDLTGAAAFDPRDFATDLSEVDPLSENGRGLGLIMHYADAVEYGQMNGRNRLSLRFQKKLKNRHAFTGDPERKGLR